MPVLQLSGYTCEMASQQKRCQGIEARLLSTPTCCWWAALAFITATPSLLRHGPTRLPICEAIGAIVRIGRCNRLWSWQDDGLRWRCSWRATAAVDSAAPRFLVGGP